MLNATELSDSPQRRKFRAPAIVVVAMLLACFADVKPAAAQLCVQLNGAAYKQDFNNLAVSGTSNTSSSIPIGFAFSESGTGNNVTYAAGDGSSATANTYSFGTGTNTDRAFGEVTGALQSTLGACFVNNTGFVITSFSIGYTGEQWRLGAADAVNDRLDFQFSTNATSLNDGAATWTDVNTLDFISPVALGAGALNGNAAANRHTFTPTAIIPASGIPHGATFFIRWLPTNIAGANDGLAIDDFTFTQSPMADFNLDGVVDGIDLLALQRNYGTTSGASISLGDANKDGAVDALDMLLWRSLYNGPPFAGSGAETAVPEPTGLALAVFAATGLAALARKRRESNRSQNSNGVRFCA